MKYGTFYNVTVKDSPGKGRGVFTEEYIAANTLVSVECALVLSDVDDLRSHKLFQYLCALGNSLTITLGVGSLMNHSEQPNIRVERLVQEERFEFYSLRDISPGEELTHRYVRQLWFSPIGG